MDSMAYIFADIPPPFQYDGLWLLMWRLRIPTYTFFEAPMASWERQLPAPTITSLGGGNSNICLFSPRSLGKWSKFDEHVFQMGWSHQLAAFALFELSCRGRLGDVFLLLFATCIVIHDASMGRTVYLPTFTIKINHSWCHVGKYTSPMDATGYDNYQEIGGDLPWLNGQELFPVFSSQRDAVFWTRWITKQWVLHGCVFI